MEKGELTFDISETSDLTSRSSDTASDIENAHLGLESSLKGEVVFVTRDRLVEGLSLVVSAEMERSSPSVLVQFGGTLRHGDIRSTRFNNASLERERARTKASEWEKEREETHIVVTIHDVLVTRVPRVSVLSRVLCRFLPVLRVVRDTGAVASISLLLSRESRRGTVRGLLRFGGVDHLCYSCFLLSAVWHVSVNEIKGKGR